MSDEPVTFLLDDFATVNVRAIASMKLHKGYRFKPARLDWVTPTKWKKQPDASASRWALAAKCGECGNLKAVIPHGDTGWHLMENTCQHVPQEPTLDEVNKAARKTPTALGGTPSIRV